MKAKKTQSASPIPPRQLCVLYQFASGKFFRQAEKGGHEWVALCDADVLPRRRWMVADGEALVPVMRVTTPIWDIPTQPTAKPPEPEIPWSEIFPEEPTKETPSAPSQPTGPKA